MTDRKCVASLTVPGGKRAFACAAVQHHVSNDLYAALDSPLQLCRWRAGHLGYTQREAAALPASPHSLLTHANCPSLIVILPDGNVALVPAGPLPSTLSWHVPPSQIDGGVRRATAKRNRAAVSTGRALVRWTEVLHDQRTDRLQLTILLVRCRVL